MASLNSLYFKKETLEILLKTVNAKNEKGVEITVSINDDTNNYGQNISAYVAQSKEQREAKKQRFYVANGKTFWTDGSIKVAERTNSVNVPAEQQTTQEEVDLPF